MLFLSILIFLNSLAEWSFFSLHKGEPISVKKAFAYSPRLFMRFIGARILLALKANSAFLILYFPSALVIGLLVHYSLIATTFLYPFIAAAVIISSMPAINIFMKNFFAGFSLVNDEQLSLSEDTKKSHLLTQNNLWQVFISFLLMVLLPYVLFGTNIAPSIIGSLITAPFFILMQVDIYKQLEAAELS